MYFIDREDAAEKLLPKIRESVQDFSRLLLLAIPRGGVVLGAYLCKKLRVPLDILVVKKVTHPSNPEYALGAVCPKGEVLFDDVHTREVSCDERAELVRAAYDEVKRQLKEFRGDRPYPSVKDKHVMIVDDGLATGLTMERAVACVRACGAREISVAVPVASDSAVARVRKVADRVICIEQPNFFLAVGQSYVDYPQVSDAEVHRLLDGVMSRK